LLGYLYAHLTVAWLGTRRQAIVHVFVALVWLAALPIAIDAERLAHSQLSPVLLVLVALAAAVGFPFLVLSSSSPLLQRWFAATAHAGARDPYFLYAASNAGSLGGLVAYPLFLEPGFSLQRQSHLWLYGFIGFVLLSFACALLLRVSPAGRDRALPRSDPLEEARPSLARRSRWMALSFAPSSLLLGVTSYLTTDIASVPLLWIVPLSLYLLSFVFAFQRNSWASHVFLVRRQGFLLLAAAVTVFARATNPAWILLPLHLLAFFVTALICHGELARDRPAARHLTEYFLLISAGGVLGGFFNALLAPLIFTEIIEYPLAMIAAGLLRPHLAPSNDHPLQRRLDILLPLALGVALAAVVYVLQRSEVLPERFTHVIVLGIPALLVLSFAYRPIRFGLGILAMMFGLSGYLQQYGRVIYADRSFFGVYRVAFDRSGKYHVIFHGTTAHGMQSLDPARRLESLSYFHRTGPAGQVFGALAADGFAAPVAVIGLGAGSLACFGKAGQEFLFYELDPLVERIARDPRLFTYLRDCPPKVAVTIGDARVMLARAPERHYGLLIVDAFSSDSIPIHLLTAEALALYLAKLDDEGLLLFHISNRYFDLAPVLDRLALHIGATAMIQHDVQVGDAESDAGKSPSIWVMMARDEKALGRFAGNDRWKVLDGRLNGDLWTDDYSNILRVLHLR
jgi:hypothetical protein